MLLIQPHKNVLSSWIASLLCGPLHMLSGAFFPEPVGVSNRLCSKMTLKYILGLHLYSTFLPWQTKRFTMLPLTHPFTHTFTHWWRQNHHARRCPAHWEQLWVQCFAQGHKEAGIEPPTVWFLVEVEGAGWGSGNCNKWIAVWYRWIFRSQYDIHHTYILSSSKACQNLVETRASCHYIASDS